MEILNHLVGTCGEFHPNLFTTLMFLGLVIISFKTYKKVQK